MNTTNVATALTALIQLTLQAQKIQQLLQLAHSEDRDISSAELDQLVSDDDAARAALVSAIKSAREV